MDRDKRSNNFEDVFHLENVKVKKNNEERETKMKSKTANG